MFREQIVICIWLSLQLPRTGTRIIPPEGLWGRLFTCISEILDQTTRFWIYDLHAGSRQKAKHLCQHIRILMLVFTVIRNESVEPILVSVLQWRNSCGCLKVLHDFPPSPFCVWATLIETPIGKSSIRDLGPAVVLFVHWFSYWLPWLVTLRNPYRSAIAPDGFLKAFHRKFACGCPTIFLWFSLRINMVWRLFPAMSSF
jgi:hypothetical protein